MVLSSGKIVSCIVKVVITNCLNSKDLSWKVSLMVNKLLIDIKDGLTNPHSLDKRLNRSILCSLSEGFKEISSKVFLINKIFS